MERVLIFVIRTSLGIVLDVNPSVPAKRNSRGPPILPNRPENGTAIMRALQENYGWNPIESAPFDEDVTLHLGRHGRLWSILLQTAGSLAR
jgi:hypothetical protein